MNSAFRNIIFTAALALSFNAQAVEFVPGELQPLQAHTVVLGDYTAVIYYTVLENGIIRS